MNATRHDPAVDFDPSLEDLLRYAIAVGVVLVLLLPAARGFNDTFGWLPLWLLAMPVSAWWVLRRVRRPREQQGEARLPRRRRRSGAQARRRSIASPQRPQVRAA